MLLKMFTDPLDTLKILQETFLGHNQLTLSFEKSILLIRKTKKKGKSVLCNLMVKLCCACLQAKLNCMMVKTLRSC